MIGTDVYRAWRAACRGDHMPFSQHLPTGLGGTDGHPQAGLYKMRQGGGYQAGVKQSHTWVPVKILLMLDPNDETSVRHKWEEGLKPVAIVGKGDPANALRIWSWCLERVDDKTSVLRAIDKTTYDFWLTHERWPDDAPADPISVGAQAPDVSSHSTKPEERPASSEEATPTIGHNSGETEDSIEAMMRAIEMQDVAFTEWMAKAPEGQSAADKASNWEDEVKKIEKRVLAAYRVEKDPILELEKACEEKWRPLKKRAADLVARIHKSFLDLALKERQRKQKIADEEAAKRQAEINRQHAEAAKRAAEERAKALAAQTVAEKAGDGAPAAAPIPEEPPPPPPPPKVVAAPVKTLFGGASGSRRGIRSISVAVITDWKAAAAHYAGAVKVRDEVQKLANADAKNGIACPGATIEERAA